MKKCTICGQKIKKNNDASSILGYHFDNPKIQTICIECKKDLLYSTILSPF